LVCATKKPALVNPDGRVIDAVMVWLLVDRIRPRTPNPSEDGVPEEQATSNKAPQTNRPRPNFRAMKFS
jgi:hypothetical protein